MWGNSCETLNCERLDLHRFSGVSIYLFFPKRRVPNHKRHSTSFQVGIEGCDCPTPDKDFDTNQSASEELTESCDLVACLELLLPTILKTTKGLLAIWDMNNFGFAE